MCMCVRETLNFLRFVVTEAGFGADIGCEKFMDIKCRWVEWRICYESSLIECFFNHIFKSEKIQFSENNSY